MPTHTTLTSLFTDIANAIRTKKGTSGTIVADDFPSEIASIETNEVEYFGMNEEMPKETYHYKPNDTNCYIYNICSNDKQTLGRCIVLIFAFFTTKRKNVRMEIRRRWFHNSTGFILDETQRNNQLRQSYTQDSALITRRYSLPYQTYRLQANITQESLDTEYGVYLYACFFDDDTNQLIDIVSLASTI